MLLNHLVQTITEKRMIEYNCAWAKCYIIVLNLIVNLCSVVACENSGSPKITRVLLSANVSGVLSAIYRERIIWRAYLHRSSKTNDVFVAKIIFFAACLGNNRIFYGSKFREYHITIVNMCSFHFRLFKGFSSNSHDNLWWQPRSLPFINATYLWFLV